MEGRTAVKRLSDLGVLFRVVAGLELAYALVAVLTPPSQVTAVTGWVLSADGQWLTKLLGLALASQAWVAWTLRNQPHLGVAKGLAFYQLASATADWVLWIVLADQGIFSTTTGRLLVAISIPTHYLLGLLLVRAIRRAQPPQRPPHSRRQDSPELRARRHDAPTGPLRQQAQIQGRPLRAIAERIAATGPT
jgi:hypothetical protein